MKLLIILAAVILAVNSLTAKDQWEEFKKQHKKSYINVKEESYRYSIFLGNLKKIADHNAKYEAGLETYTMGVNQFADLTPEEFQRRLGFQRQTMPEPIGEVYEFPEDLSIPDSIDWREKGAVLPVEDQGACGSCWAFSATGALEGQNFIKNNVSLLLSKQELMDCSRLYGNGDCIDGGRMTYAYEYVFDHGIQSEDDYPYEEVIWICRSKEAKKVLRIHGYQKFKQTEEELKKAVGSLGPISISIFADPFQLYSSGIFNSTSCINDRYKLDHGMLIVGYGEENNKPYWLIKNSWGTTWGEDGYLRLARNSERCGVALLSSYPIL